MESVSEYIARKFSASEPVSVETMTDFILSRGWELAIREMPGGDIMVRVSVIGQPYIARAEHYETALSEALKRALHATGELPHEQPDPSEREQPLLRPDGGGSGQ